MTPDKRTFEAADLSAWAAGPWEGPVPRRVTGVSIDTRTLSAGDLYIAIRGDLFDGHAFIDKALSRGAAGVVADQQFQATVDGPCLRVRDTRRALTGIASGHRSAMRAAMIGITGSVGKTTVKEMAASALSTLGPTACTRGNWNNDLGLPLSLLTMHNTDVFGVFEVGMNHPGELEPLCQVLAPSWGIMTPVGMAHSEAFAAEADIVDEKASLFRVLPKDGGAVISRDQKWFARLADAADCAVVTTSLVEDADYRGELCGPHRFEVLETATGDRVSFENTVPGRFMAENALLAIALARRFGAGWDDLLSAISSYQPLPMRWEESCVGGKRFVNDAYNANPMSMRAAADALSALPEADRTWLVLAGMFELGDVELAEHIDLGRYLSKGPWAGIVTVGRLGALIADGAEDAGYPASKIVRCDGHEEAASSLRLLTTFGDTILLKGSRGEHLERILHLLTKDSKAS